MARKLVVEIIGDASKLTRSFNQSTTAANKFGTQVSGAMGKAEKSMLGLQRIAAGGFFGAAAVGAGLVAIKETTDAASDLAEQVSKNKQVFGDSAGAVEAWSATTADSIGVAQTAALEATGTFGNLLGAVGLAGPQAAQTSKRFVQLAADLASFNNADPTEALEALRSGLVGEAEPLRRFGVLLSEARVKQVALAQTGKDNVRALTEQEKALARVSIIFKDTQKAQGDFERTSGSLANQQRILAARTADLETNLGKLLLPTMIRATESMNLFAQGALAATEATGGFLDALGKIGTPKGQKGRFVPGIGFVIEPELTKIMKPDEGTRGATAGAADAVRKRVKDAMGPLVREIPKALQEALLDAEIAGAGSAAVRAILVRQQSALMDALDDPRLKQAGRLQVKRAIKGVTDSITAIDQEAAAAVKAAAAGRRSKAADAAADAARKRAKAVAKAVADATKAATAEQQRQFRAIGLTGAGGELIPGIPNLKKQFAQLSRSVVGEDVPQKLLNRLALVGKALAGGIKNITPDTRDAINDLYGTIRSTFDQETDKGLFTKTTALNKNKLLEGLGLTPDIERALRARLSGFNSAGQRLGGTPGAVGAFGIAFGPGGKPIEVINVNTITLDGDVVARNTTRSQNRRRQANPTQKRGANSRA